MTDLVLSVPVTVTDREPLFGVGPGLTLHWRSPRRAPGGHDKHK